MCLYWYCYTWATCFSQILSDHQLNSLHDPVHLTPKLKETMLILHNLSVGMAMESKVLISSDFWELLILLWSAAARRILHESLKPVL